MLGHLLSPALTCWVYQWASVLFLVVLVAVPTFGIETVHPGNLKRIASREALVEFLATAASGKQVSVLSYEDAYLDLGYKSLHVSTFSAAAYEARKDRRLAFGLLGPWMKKTVEKGILMQLGCHSIHECETGLHSSDLREHLDNSWKLVAVNCTAASAVERCFLFPDPKFDKCCLARHATGHIGADNAAQKRGFHIGRWLKEKAGNDIKSQRLSGQSGPEGPGHYLPALKSRDKGFEAAASGRHDHDIMHAHSMANDAHSEL